MKIILDIKGKKVKLTLEQARELYDSLDDIFGEEDKVIHEHYKMPDWQYPPPVVTPPMWPEYDPIVWCYTDTNFEGTVGAASCNYVTIELQKYGQQVSYT